MAYPPPFQPQYYTPQELPTGLSVASMVCGIVSLPMLCIWYLSLPLAVVAIVLGIIARGQVRRGIAGGGGIALAGIICGSATLAICVLVLILVFGFAVVLFSAGAHH